MSASLDLGALVGHVALDAVQFDRTYVRVVRQMSDLGAKAEASTAGTSALDKGLTGVAGASDAATAGLGSANKALSETGLAASRAAAATQAAAAATQRTVGATTEAGLASSKLTQAQLRQTAAQERLSALQETGTATTRQLASAQATLIGANDRVAISQERAAQSMVFGARSADTMRSRWEAIPGPVKLAAAAIGVIAVESLKAAANYQKLTVNLVTGAGESQRNLKMVSDGILHMAGQVGDSAQSLAKAMFTVESAGFHGAAGLTILKTAAQGAKVDNADLTVVVDALTSAMNAYHEPAANAARVTNTLIASAAVGKMHLQDLAASLGTVLPSAAALRVPLDQVGAALATMTMQGTNADRAATYLRFSFAALANPTAKAQKAMQDVGLTSQQVADTMTHGGLPAVFTLLQTAVGEKFPAGSAKYLAALANMVGGTRGLQAVLELTGSNLVTMQRNLDSIQGRVHDAGNSVSDWTQVQKNLNVEWSKFIDGLGAAGIKLGEVLLPAAGGLLHVLVDVGSAVAATASFFEHNTVAASMLAGVLAAVLVPKLAESALWLGRVIAMNAAAAFLAIRAAVAEAAAAFVAAEGGVAGFAAAMQALDLNPVVAALAVVTATALTLWHVLGGGAQAEARKGAQAVDAYVKSLGPLNDSLDAAKAHAADLHAHLADAIGNFGSGNIDRQVGALREWAKQAQAAGATAKTMASNEAGLQNQFGLSRREVETLARAYGIDLTKSYGQVAAAVQGVLTPTQQATATTKALGRAAQGSADEVKALTAALNLFAGDAISADQGAIAFRNDIVALDKALHKSAGSLDLNSQAGRDARDALDTVAQQALNTAEAQAKLRNGTDKARATLQDEIKTLKEHAGNSAYARDMIHELQRALDHLPASAGAAAQGMSAKGRIIAAAAASDAALASKAITGSVGAARTAGQNFGLGYAGGVNSPANRQAIAAAAAALGHLAAAALKAAQKSWSPSRVAHGLGAWWGEGYALGIASMGGQVASAAAGLAMTAAQAAAAATRKVYATISAAVAPTVTDPSALAAILAADTSHAIGRQQNASIAGAHYTELEQHAKALTRDLSALQRADKAAQDAADRHATSLANEAHAAHEAAANMAGAGKAAAAAKHAAEIHARALDDEARAARQAATDLRKANADQEKAAQHLADQAQKQADRAKNAYDRMGQAAQAAAQQAAQAAQALVQSVQDATSAMLSTISDFESTVRQGVTGDYSLATIWANVSQDYTTAADAVTAATTAVAKAQDQLTRAQNTVDASKNPTANQMLTLSNATDTLAQAQQTLTDAQNTLAATAAPTAAAVQQSLEDILTNAQHFSADLNALTAEGANRSLIDQIVGMGPKAGDAFAEAVLAAGPTMVASFNTVLGSISSVADSEAAHLGQVFFGAGVDILVKLLQGLEKAFPELTKALDPILASLADVWGNAGAQSGQAYAAGLAAAMAGQFPSPVTTTVGKAGLGAVAGLGGVPGPATSMTKATLGGALPHFAGGVTGFAGGLAYVGERGPEVVSLPTGANVYPHGAAVTATLDAESQALLRQVVTTMQARPVVLAMTRDGQRVIGEVAQDHRTERQLHGDPRYRR